MSRQPLSLDWFACRDYGFQLRFASRLLPSLQSKFTGVVGLAFSLLLAIILYPRQSLVNKKFKRIIQKYSKMTW